MAAIPTIKLNSGYNMPLLGLGTSGLSGEKATEATHSALDLGYTHIDSAVMYGNEAQIGEALGKQLKDGKVKRDDLFIVTKLSNTTPQHSKDGVIPAIQESLQKLQLDYVDLVLIHWPVVTDKPAEEVKEGVLEPSAQDTWKGLEAAVEKGLVRSIGISNFSPEKIDEWFKGTKIYPAVNQVEVHPHFRNEKLLKYCADKGIAVTSYAPVSSPATMSSMGNKVPNLLTEESAVKQLADKLGKTPAQVMLAWHIQQGRIAIPRSGSSSHQKENLEAIDLKLSEDDLKTLSTIKFQKRYFSGQGLGWGDDRPWKNYEQLWNEKPLD